MSKIRLKEQYEKTVRSQLQKELGISNVMEVPKISKIVLNVGVKEAVNDAKILKTVADVMQRIAGQAPVRTIARKSIAGFKIREGMPLGVMVTLRKDRMYVFLDKLINLALPNVRDFQGLKTKLDGRGNYNLGIKEWSIFPEADRSISENIFGMNITIHTTAGEDKRGLELLKSFGMPFKKTQTGVK